MRVIVDTGVIVDRRNAQFLLIPAKYLIGLKYVEFSEE